MPDRSIIDPSSAMSFRYRCGLAAITLLALVVRLVIGWRMPLLGDEIGTWMYMEHDYRFLLTSFRDPWLSMGPFIAATKYWSTWFGTDPLVLRIPVMVASSLAAPMAAVVLLRLRGTPSMVLLAALLVALNPYLVSFGVTLRSYAMVVFVSLAALNALLRWIDRPGWGHGVRCAGWCAAGLLAHLCFLYFLVFLGCVLLVDRWRLVRDLGWPSVIRGVASLAVPVALSVGLAGLSYWPQRVDMARFKAAWSGTSPTLPTYLPYAMDYYFASGWLLVPSMVLLAAGWLLAVQRRRFLALIVGAGALIPVFLYAASGSQHLPWGSARFLIYMLPLLLIQISVGVVDLSSSKGKRLVMGAILLASWVPGLQELYRTGGEQPWGAVASQLREWSRPGDAILVPGNKHLALLPFFKDVPDRLTFAEHYLDENASSSTDSGHRLFLVITMPWKTSRPSLQRGTIHATLYAEHDRHAAAAALVRDLLDNLNGRANPELVPVIQYGLALMEALDWDAAERLATQRLYYHSIIQGRDGLFLPPVQRAIRYP